MMAIHDIEWHRKSARIVMAIYYIAIVFNRFKLKNTRITPRQASLMLVSNFNCK